MFTGIVEELGVVTAATPAAAGGARLVISAATVLEGSQVGDSIAVNGCCLTVTELGPGWWAADAVAETLARTNLGGVADGDPVNLERPVAVGSRLGGHFVQGHVDAVGEVVRAAPDLEVRVPEHLVPYLVEKGSVTVDGISLTVVSVTASTFTVAVIPHTMAVTTLGRRVAGDQVNLEVDIIAKYAEQLLRGGTESPYRKNQGPSGPLSGDQGPSGPLSGDQRPSGPLSGDQRPSGPLSGDQGPSGPLSGVRG